MKSLLTAAGAALLLATSAHAQTTAPDAPATPEATMPAPSSTGVAPSANSSLTLNDAEAKNWLNKVVYSSDDKNLGEVAQIARDSSGRVTELHADIGGFLGLGETRVRVMPEQFKLMGDRVILNITSEQAKALPKVESAN